MLLRSRQEAASVQQGANRYAEQVLGELDSRLQEMGKVVIAGRRELVRLQSSDLEVPPDQGNSVSTNRSNARKIGRRSA